MRFSNEPPDRSVSAGGETPRAGVRTAVAGSLGIVAGVGLTPLRAGSATGATKAYLITLGLVGVALSWALVHTVFMLRYARNYSAEPVGGIQSTRTSRRHTWTSRLLH